MMERRALFSRLLMVIDAGVMAAAFLFSYYAKKLFPAIGVHRLRPLEHYLWILLLAIPLWWLLLYLDGAYGPEAGSPGTIVKRILKVGVLVLLTLTFFLLYLLKFETFNRSLLLLFVCAATLMLLCTHLGFSSWLTFRRRTGKSAGARSS